MSTLKKLNGTIHWYDNSSNEGMVKIMYRRKEYLVYVTNSQCKFKPVLNDGDKVRVVYFDGISNVIEVKS